MKGRGLRFLMSAVAMSFAAVVSMAVEPGYAYYDSAALDRLGGFIEVDSAAVGLAIEVRASLTSPSGHRASDDGGFWGLAWNYSDSLNYDYAKLFCNRPKYFDVADYQEINLAVGRVRCGVDSVDSVVALKHGVSPLQQANSLAAEWKDGVLRLYCGSRSVEEVGVWPSAIPSGMKCRLIHSQPFSLDNLVVESEPDAKLALMTQWTVDALKKRFEASDDPLEGFWEHLDRETDDSRARLGGRYLVALVREGDGYSIIYIDGAQVNRSGWTAGMKKGELVPSRFENHFNLLWIDSMFLPIEEEGDPYATVEADAVLTLYFPVYKSQLRLFKRQDFGI